MSASPVSGLVVVWFGWIATRENGMRTETIRSFLAVYEAGSFTAAAKRLYTEQPVITKRVSCLERELGCQLFTRTTRRVIPTPAGEAFYETASEAMVLLDRASAAARLLSAKQDSVLRLGYHYLYMDSLTTGWIKEFEESCGMEISVAYSEAALHTLIRQVADGQIDGCFVGTTDEAIIPSYLRRQRVMDMGEVVLVGKTHRLAGRSSVALDDLLDETFAYPAQPPTADNSVVLKDFEDAGREVHMWSTSFESSALRLVERGDAIIDLPSESPVPSNDVVIIPYESKRQIHYQFVWNVANKSEVFEKFREFIIDKTA